MVEIRLLGPVEVWAATGRVEVGPPQRRAVLAALAADAGRPVPLGTVVDRVWDERPPSQALAAVYSHVSRLRDLVGDAGRLARRSGGDALDLDPDRVDLHRFRRLAEDARKRPDAERVDVLAEALRLWRGPALAGLPGAWPARARAAWGQERVDVAVDWARAALRLGRHADVISPVRALAEEYPLAEPLVAVLMSALVGAGRPAEALDRYAVARLRLVEELGAEPGPELRDLHAVLLRGGPTRPDGTRPDGTRPDGTRPDGTRPDGTRHGTAASTDATPAGGPAVVPAQLPADVAGFAGRADAVARLDTVLAGTGQRAAVVVSAVSGTAGVGKTALAVHWAHRVSERFPDGQLYVNLRGFDPTGPGVSPADALRGFLDALGVPPRRVPSGLDARVGLYRSLLAGRRLLVLLDNARDAEQVRPLLPGSPGSLVVVTSRNRLSGLVAVDGAVPLALDLLTPSDARELLSRRLGADRVAAEPDAVEEVIAGCARLPLALAVVAARAAGHPDFPLAALAAELHAAHGALDAFASDDAAADVRAALSWSYRALRPGAARLFRLLGLHPGPDVSAPAAASLAGIPPAAARPLLSELAGVHLITEHAPGRYAFHDLLRAYARELTGSRDPDTERSAAVHRMLDHYLHTAHAAALLLDPHRDPIDPTPARPGVTVEPARDSAAAVAWFTAEYRVLLAVATQPRGPGFDTHAWQLTWTLTDFLDRRALWHEQAAAMLTAVQATRRLNHLPGQAYAHRLLARAYIQLARRDDALVHLHHALDLFGRLGDHAGQAHTHVNFTRLLALQGQHAEAVEHAERALQLYRTAGHRVGEANALNAVGYCQAKLGDYDRALVACRQALSLSQQIDDRSTQAFTWDSLAFVYSGLGEHREAAAGYLNALRIYRGVGDRYEEADTLTHLGESYRDAGDLGAARVAWRSAVSVLDSLDHPDADALRQTLEQLDGARG